MHKYNHEFHLNKFLHNQYNDLLIADTFRILALSMISLFIPIFLLKHSFSLLEIIFMELVLLVSCIILHYFVLHKVGKWGIKKTLILSYFSNIGLFLVMYYYQSIVANFNNFFFLTLIIFFNTIASVFYWSAHHIYFLKSTLAENEGKKLGILLSIPSLVGITSPLLGAILIEEFSFQAAFLFSIVFMIIASVCLFFTKDIKIEVSMNWKKIFCFNKPKRNLIYFIYGANYATTGFLWPIMLFYLSIKIILIGVLSFFSNIFYSLIVYLGGVELDTNNTSKIKLGRIGFIGHGFSLIFRAISQTILPLTIFQSLGGFFGGLLHIVLDSCFYKKSHQHMANMIMNRELYMHLGRIFIILILLINLIIFDKLISAFIVTMVISGILTFVLNIIIQEDVFN